MYRTLLRPLLFNLDSERAHHLALGAARFAGRIGMRPIVEKCFELEDPALSTDCFGLHFKNPIGLAAGFDKNVHAVEMLAALGFGFIEIGSITGQPQPGNPTPRIFRFPADQAIINRMGFPSDGADAVAPRLQEVRRSPNSALLGVNLGKTKAVALDNALDDYLYTFSRIKDYADYVALNVSSPNTPELRKLQERSRLEALFRGVQRDNSRGIPLLVKVAPDLEPAQVDEVLACCLDCGVSGIIATNTTFSREGLSRPTEETGGLSGAPLRKRSLEMVRYISRQTQGKLPIIGVGGVFCGRDAFELISAGASLIQIYTGLIYEGPGLVRKVKSELLGLMKESGISRLGELVGKANK
ncbi:MAG: quinone-dependent dihydroorotate dehydrogenase [Deltaproteobacteria bacterium]|nr:quinone-dependent dihydroorotate dehydrogenase [Deltaproteobacteria bacterium]